MDFWIGKTLHRANGVGVFLVLQLPFFLNRQFWLLLLFFLALIFFSSLTHLILR